VVGAVLLTLSAPALVAAAVAIKATSPGPVLFHQQRIGKGGNPFVVYKLRTMANDAEQEHAEFAARRGVDGQLFKLEADPRVTRGRALPATEQSRRGPPAVERAAR